MAFIEVDEDNFEQVLTEEFDKKQKDVPLSPAEQRRFDNILESLRGQ